MDLADIKKTFEVLMRPLRRRVALMIGRATVRLTDDSKKRQELQLEGLKGEILGDVEHFQPYGYTSHAPTGSETILMAIGGARQHPVSIMAEDKNVRPRRLPQGDVMLYTEHNTPADPHFVRMKNGRVTEIRSGASKITVDPHKIVIESTTVEVKGSQGTWTIP